MNIVITGHLSGLGAALAARMKRVHNTVYGYDIREGHDVRYPDRFWLEAVNAAGVDVLINCAAVNRINWLENVPPVEFENVLMTNAGGIFRMSQALLPALIDSKGTILNIVSNASHSPMRCSLAYNASKGAAHIMTLQLARELTPKYGITVFGVSPNKLSGTGMSNDIDEQVMATRGWTREEAERYQLAGLLTGEETPVDSIAEFIAFLLSSKERHKYLSGTIIPYGA